MEDSVACSFLSSRAMRDARASDDAQYDPFDDEESIPSLPELKEDDDDPIPMLQEATAATTRPSLQSDDDIPDLLDAPKQEDNSVDLEILHALAASPIRDASPLTRRRVVSGRSWAAATTTSRRRSWASPSSPWSRTCWRARRGPKFKTRTCSTRRSRTTTPSRRRAELALVRGAAGDARARRAAAADDAGRRV